MGEQMIQVDNGNFVQRSSASEELSFLGAVIFGLGISHYFLDHFTIGTSDNVCALSLQGSKPRSCKCFNISLRRT